VVMHAVENKGIVPSTTLERGESLKITWHKKSLSFLHPFLLLTTKSIKTCQRIIITINIKSKQNMLRLVGTFFDGAGMCI
jgi:hypothetical protein